MPREVFADEIEAFLERLDAVAAARVVSNESGEIERIYVTSESARDDTTIRRAITSALMSQFSLPVDGWRVQIAHLEPVPQAEPIPECHLVRLEETITETMTRIVVDLRYERDGAQKTVTGSAQAPAGQVHRLRTVALATIDALRPLVERSGSRPSLEGLTFMPFASSTVVLAGVTLISERMSLLRVGVETVSGSEAEAVVAALLDAFRKPVRPVMPPGAGRSDRHQQFEGLRQQYERLIRTDAAAPPLPPEPAWPESPGPAPPGAAPSEPEAGPGWDDTTHPRASASVATAAPPMVAPPVAAPPVASPPSAVPPPVAPPIAMLSAQDVIHDLSEIRPEREGGALVMREETRHDSPAAAKPVPRMSFEDTFYRRLAATGVPVHIRCRDGYEIPTAIIKDFGMYAVMVEVNGVQEMVFKHGIISIRPYGPLPPESMPPS